MVKLVGEESVSPRHLSDQEEQALVAAVMEKGDMRDQAIIVLMLYTGLRAQEACAITRDNAGPDTNDWQGQYETMWDLADADPRRVRPGVDSRRCVAAPPRHRMQNPCAG